MKFGDIFGDPKMVDDSMARALAEAIADAVGAGNGMSGDWDPDFELSGETEDGDDRVELTKAVLVDAIASISQMLQNLVTDPAQRRVVWRALASDLIQTSPKWGQFAVMAYEMNYLELTDDARRIQLEAFAKAQGKSTDDPEVQATLAGYPFVGALSSLQAIEDPERQMSILQGVQSTVTQLTLGLASRLKEGLGKKKGSGIVGLGGEELPSTQS